MAIGPTEPDAAGAAACPERFVRVRDLAGARAASARPGLVPVTETGLAAFAGVGFWRAVEEELGRPVVVDCGDDAGLAMGALRAGCRDLLFTGPEALAAKLADMAAQLGGTVRRGLDGPGPGAG